MNDIIEIENALHILDQKKIENLFNSEVIDWHYSYKNPSLDTPTYNRLYQNHQSYKDSPVFFHLFYQKDLFLPNTNRYEKLIKEHDIIAIFQKNIQKYLQKDISIIRMMGVMIPPNPLYDGLCMTPHTDWDIPHKTCIYYVNTTDAGTILFTNRLENKVDSDPGYVISKVVPKRGKICMFDGLRYHSSNVSKTLMRIVLNINFIEE